MISPDSPRSYLDSLQVFRGLAAVWVLIFHVESIAELRMGHSPFRTPFVLAGGDAVAFFFVLSGFIITHVHWRHLGDKTNVRPYLARRLSRIYPLVFVLVAAKLLFIGVTGAGIDGKELSAGAVAASFLLLPSGIYVIDVLWTLAFEIIFYVLFAVAVAAGRRPAIMGGIIWAILILARQSAGLPDEHVTFAGTVFHPMCLLFLIGAVAARIFASPRWRPRLGILWIPGVVMMAVWIWYPHVFELLPDSRPLRALAGCVPWGVGSAMLILSAASIEQRSGFRWPRWLRLLGDASYSIYVVHTSVMMVFYMFIRRAGVDLDRWLVPVLVIMGISGLAVSLAFWKWVEVPLMSWWNSRIRPRLSGERKMRDTTPVPVIQRDPVAAGG